MSVRKRAWLDVVYSRLQSLGPGEWTQIGPIFDKVRLLLPLESAMRSAVARLPKGHAIPNADKAQWLLFCNRLVSEIDYKSPRRWREYSDEVRLKTVATCVCGGPVTKLRGRRGKGFCLACRKETTVLLDIRAKVKRKRRAPKPPQPAPEVKEPVPVTVMAVSPNGLLMTRMNKAEDGVTDTWRWIKPPLHPPTRRQMAIFVRNLLPMGRQFSINYIEREIDRQRGDVLAVFRRYGISDHRQLVTLINNRHMLESLGLVR